MRSPFPAAVALFTLLSPTAQRAQGPDWQFGIAKVSVHPGLNKKPGTAFVVSLTADAAYLVTSAHVVAGDGSPTVRFEAAPDQKPGKVTIYKLNAEDLEHGLAILKVDRPPPGVVVLEPASIPPIGTRVMIAGYPAPDYDLEVRDPIISRYDGLDLVLSQAAGEGFSGGPVLLGSTVVGLYFGFTDTGRAAKATFVDLFLRENKVPWGAAGPTLSALKAGVTKLNPRDGLLYVYIPGGSFQMGCLGDGTSSAGEGCEDDEKPSHRVTISKPFWIGQTEVTVEAYERYRKGKRAAVAALPEDGFSNRKINTASGDPETPVLAVTWAEARDYCAAAGLRLPSEAEWEYAARAGDQRARYDAFDDMISFGNRDEFYIMAGNTPHRVGLKPANPWAIREILGNALEWVADWYGDRYYHESVERDPKGPEYGTHRVVRGGTKHGERQSVRFSCRFSMKPSMRLSYVGFRCAGDLP